MSTRAQRRPAAHGRIWLAAGLVCTALIAASDAALLEVTRGGFGNGFGGVLLDGAGIRLAYLALSAALDGFAVALLWVPLAALLRRSGTPPWRALALAIAIALGAAAWADVLVYRIHTTVGALVAPGVVLELAGHEASSFYEASTVASGVLVAGAVLSASLLWLALRASDRVAAHLREPERRLAPPRGRALLAIAVVLGGASTLVLAQRSAASERLREAVRLQPGYALLVAIVTRATDVDGDGAGLLSLPPDPAPFDGRVHAWALDLPGNGIDENRLAGDLPASTPAPRPIGPPLSPPRHRPHVLVVYLESFRRDVQGARLGDRPVTPFLDALAREGASFEHAFVHSPYTTRSRAQLFQGALDPRPGARTWIDDFNALGYRTAHFSGQDDSFGGSEALLGVARADAFYDARSDTARRTSRSTAPASLQVSWRLLLERVGRFLADVRSDQPLFLYVNLVDTHYPYHHDGLDDLLGVDPVPRDAIRSSNREQVWRTYLNAAANVDRAIEQLVGRFREAIGGADHAILVTSDHGQSFYEDGTLGHGRALDERQTHVPLVVWGLGGRWPEPVGASDLRGLLLRALDAPRARRPQIVPDPQRHLLQYLPNLEQPLRLASRGLDGTLEYDFARERVTRHRPGGAIEPAARDARFEALIHAWERLRVDSEVAQHPADAAASASSSTSTADVARSDPATDRR